MSPSARRRGPGRWMTHRSGPGGWAARRPHAGWRGLARRSAIVLLAALFSAYSLAAGAALAAGEGEPGADKEYISDPGAMPRNLTQVSGNCVVRLTWEAPQTPRGDVLAYEVYRWKDEALGDPEWIGSTKPSQLSYDDFGVVNGRTYVYAVRARYEGKVESETPGTVTAKPAVARLAVVLRLGQTKALVNGEETTLDAPAAIVGDSTMVPLRFVATSLGAEVKYDAGPRQVTATLGTRVVRLWVGRKDAEVDGQPRPLAAPPVIVNDRTLVPLRFIAEAFGAVVNYHPDRGEVTVDLADPDSVPEKATEVKVGETLRAALNGSNDVDLYRFQASLGDTYVVRTENLADGCDTVLVVLTPELDVYYSNDDCSVDSRASEVQLFRFEESAFFYVRVQSANPGGANLAGNYDITVEKRPGNPEKWYENLLVGAPPTKGYLRSPADESYFVFNGSAGSYYEILTTNLSQPGPDGDPVESDTALMVMMLDGSRFTTLGWDDNSSTEQSLGAEFVFRAPLTTSYFIAVFSASGRFGPYEISVQEVQGDPWGNPAGAADVRPDHDCFREWLTSPGDQDWYSFAAEAGVSYWIQTTDLAYGSDTVVTLFGPDGQTQLSSSDDALGCGYGSRIAWVAPADGTYYIRVTGYGHPESGCLGSYCICVTTTGPEADNWDTDTARILTPDTPDTEPAAASIVFGDVDWFVFTATKGLTYTVETLDLQGECDTFLRLYDENWNLLAENDDVDEGNPASRVKWVATFSGLVYVQVSGFGPSAGSDDPTGKYSIRITTSTEGAGL